MPPQPESAPRVEPEVFYDWNGEGQPIAVSINLNLIDCLSMEVIEGFKSLPKRGLEIGGLLLGHVDASEHEPILVVEDREVFHSEHLLGPSFLLSPRDREQWAALATRWRDETNADLHAIGLFRSDTRPQSGFDDEDASLAQELLRDGVGIFLLIRPSAGGASRATIGILRDGALESIGEFPFQSAVLRDGTYPVSTRRASSRPAATVERPRLVLPEPKSFRATHEGATTRVRSRFNASPIQWRKLAAWGWIPLVAALTVWAAAVWKNHPSPLRQPATLTVAKSAPAPPPPAVDPLLLKVQHVGGELRLSWNHAAHVVRQAESGTLQIEDGQLNHELRLNQIELRTGSISYLPKSGDVTFQLQLSSPSRSTTESIRSVDPGYVSGDVSSAASKNVRLRRPSKRSKLNLEPAPTIVSKVAPQKPAERSTVAPPDSAPPAPASPAPVSEPARVAPASPPRTFTASFVPLSPTRLQRVMGRLSPARFVRGREDRDFVPPKPLHEAPPKSLPSLLRGVREPVSVTIRVAIDKRGRVANATVDPPAKKGPLPDAAVAAARNWIFTPARRGSTPVASQAIVHFRFQNPDFVQADR